MLIQQLQNLVDQTSPRVLGQVLKGRSHQELYNWILGETSALGDVTVSERVYYLLLGRPDIYCERGQRRTFSTKRHEYGFCNNIARCQCFADHQNQLRSPLTSDQIQNILTKRQITWQQKYGKDNPSKSTEVQQRRRQTLSSRDYSRIHARLAQDKQDAGYIQVCARLEHVVEPQFTIDEYLGSFRKNSYPWKCVICHAEFTDHVDYGRVPRCPVCYPGTVSQGETEIRKYVESLGAKVISNTRDILGDLELDIWCPDLSLAIEYNGVYWHSDQHKSTDYHVTKMLRCRELGIRLIQIFEDEWKSKPTIIKNRLAVIFGRALRTSARKCEIVELDSCMYREFCEQHHLQGYAAATHKLGLTYQGTLVAVMSFSRSRYTDSGYELIRYCSSGTVIGGASRLFKYFVTKHDPDQIISYANRCWSDGGLYLKLGFSDVTADPCNTGYWYVKNNTRYHRSSFTKSALVKAGYDTNLTEAKIMNDLGYLRIYDAGNYKFQWERKSNPNGTS
jgi:hypothetical protein